MRPDPSNFVYTPAPPPDLALSPAFWFVFEGDSLLVSSSSQIPFVSSPADLGLPPDTAAHFLGLLGGAPCFCLCLGLHGAPSFPIPGAAPAQKSPSSPAPFVPAPGYAFAGLRSLFPDFPPDLIRASGAAVGVVEWASAHRFCGRCGTSPLSPVPGERALRCPACGLVRYPRVSPAVIMLVLDGPRVLLARSPGWPSGRYSAVAGYVEPGENLEDAVRREISEEVGVRVKNIRYFMSQPWPFPNSLMMGFFADYAGGDIVPDPREIEDARWFSADALPELPGSVSLARKLIDQHLLNLQK